MSMDYLDDNIIDKEFENSVKMFSYEKRGLEFLKAYKDYVIDNVPGILSFGRIFVGTLPSIELRLLTKKIICFVIIKVH